MTRKTPEQISYNMRRVKSKNTQIELLLRKALWSRGLRYQKNVTTLLGKPDIVFKGPKVVVFCDSEFWHGYDWENRKNDIKTNRDFWIPKIERTIQRDVEVTEGLIADGWVVLRFWGKDLKQNLDKCVTIIEKTVRERASCSTKRLTCVQVSEVSDAGSN